MHLLCCLLPRRFCLTGDMLKVVYSIGVLKHFVYPSDIFWLGVIETLCLLGVLKHFEHKKIYKDLELYQVFMYNFLCWIDLNIFKHFDQKILQENSYTIFVLIPPHCILSTHTFTTPHKKLALFLFPHLLTRKNSTIF